MRKLISICVGLLFISAGAQSTMTAQKWQDDLKFLQETVHNEYPFLFKKTTKEEFDAKVKSLHESIPDMQDHEVIVGLAEVIALFKYGHTDISFRHPDFAFRQYPFNLYWFSDGMYIQGTHKDHEAALGAKVISVNGVPLQEALDKIYPVVNSENSQYFKAFGINYLRIPEVLHAKGIIQDLNADLSLTLEKNGKRFEHKFQALPKGERVPIRFSLVQQQGDWLEARDQSETPYYLSHLEKNYYYQHIPEHKMVYVRHSQVFDGQGVKSIHDFFTEVFEFIDANDVQKLVLDVRLNGGGNNYKNKTVVTGVVRTEQINKVGNFFVLMGRRTYSACQNLVLELDNYTNAIFVGEPTSENINFYGDNNRVELPNSGIPVFLSFAWWQDKPQWEDGPWHAPHIAVDMSFEQYYNNEDPYLEAALNFSAENFVLDPMDYMTELFETGQIEKLKSESARLAKDPAYKFFDFEGEFNKVGYRLLEKGRTQEAIFVFQMITSHFPESANGWDSLAEAFWKAGDKEKAKELYNKAISMDPEGPVGKNAKEMLHRMEHEGN